MRISKERYLDWLAAAALVAGFLLRLRLADLTYLHLDEAHHVKMSTPEFPDLWYSAQRPTHPPLLIFLLHGVRVFGHSELVFRAIPLLCGSLFPWFIYRWLGMVWSRGAGFAALAILAFSPTVIQLSAVVRQYTLGLFWLSVALYCLERALRTPAGGEKPWMWAFAGAQWLAVFSLFPAAFYIGALGAVGILRWPDLSRPARWIWLTAEVGCAALYVHLLVSQVIPLRALYQGLVHDPTSHYGGAFPVAGQSLFGFLLQGVSMQFLLTFRSGVAAALAGLLAVIGLAIVVLRRRPVHPRATLSLLTVALLPFALAYAGAVSGTHPFGDGRQTIVLGLSVAILTGIGLEWVFGKRTWLVAVFALASVPLWHLSAELNPLTWDPVEKRSVMREVVRHIEDNVRGQRRILTEGYTIMRLEHYLGPDAWPIVEVEGERRFNGYRLYGPLGDWRSCEQIWSSLAVYRKAHDLNPEETVWILDMGLDCPLCDADESQKKVAPSNKSVMRWDGAAILFPAPSSYEGPDQANQ